LRYTSVRGLTVAGVLALAGSLLGSTPALAQEPFECPDKRICLFDSDDGLGESKVIQIQWEGGFSLWSSGWADRVSSIANNVQYPVKLLDGGEEECKTIIATIEPGSSVAVPVEADNRTDVVYWSELDGDTGYLCP